MPSTLTQQMVMMNLTSPFWDVWNANNLVYDFQTALYLNACLLQNNEF